MGLFVNSAGAQNGVNLDRTVKNTLVDETLTSTAQCATINDYAPFFVDHVGEVFSGPPMEDILRKTTRGTGTMELDKIKNM